MEEMTDSVNATGIWNVEKFRLRRDSSATRSGCRKYRRIRGALSKFSVEIRPDVEIRVVSSKGPISAAEEDR